MCVCGSCSPSGVVCVDSDIVEVKIGQFGGVSIVRSFGCNLLWKSGVKAKAETEDWSEK